MRKFKVLSLFILTCFLINSTKDEKITVFTIGDSTMANKDTSQNNPERGWGMMFQQFFDDQVMVDNWAKNGRSSKSFIGEGLWKGVLDKLKAGDYVFIQFGHNDSKPDTTRHTDPRTTYRANLIKYIAETRAKSANPVLLTSVVRRKFDANGNLEDTHGEYLLVFRELAKEMNVPLIDMEQKSRKLVQQLGPEESKKLYMWVEPGVSGRIPKGARDDTHFRPYGATKMAELVIEGVKELNLGLAAHIKK
jgi:lysophospholipase L1-like esterase